MPSHATAPDDDAAMDSRGGGRGDRARRGRSAEATASLCSCHGLPPHGLGGGDLAIWPPESPPWYWWSRSGGRRPATPGSLSSPIRRSRN